VQRSTYYTVPAVTFYVSRFTSRNTGHGTRTPHHFSALLLALPLPPLPPAVIKVPLRKPRAKKPKYMIAAGNLWTFGSRGGIERSTDWRLFIPMMTSKSSIAMSKMVFSNSFVFIYSVAEEARRTKIETQSDSPSRR